VTSNRHDTQEIAFFSFETTKTTFFNVYSIALPVCVYIYSCRRDQPLWDPTETEMDKKEKATRKKKE
jgi:hypothetical protein